LYLGGEMKRSNNKRLATPQSVDQVIWSICDIMRRGNCAGAAGQPQRHQGTEAKRKLGVFVSWW
jgi:hypothetical protein